ncbi:MAG: SDR family oxidoreductase [Oscillospiraceae bacterium]|nr:SDR family oxidoreductase [Oscillospiraceae bacterium]
MDKTALITGSTSGIGKAFADKLASEGYNLILVSLDAEKLRIQSGMLAEKYDITVSIVSLDLAKPGAAERVFDAVSEMGLSVQVLINNAGFAEAGHFLETDMQKEAEMVHLHAIFTTEMMKLFLPGMVENGYGRVCNLGSIASYISCPYEAVYAATKAYILSVSKAIGAELKGSGVSITTLCPGATETAFAEKAKMEDALLFKLFVMDADKVAAIGYKAMMKGKPIVVAGGYNKLLVWSSKITPPGILNAVTKKMLATS